jgi:hypothetical protein
MIVTPAVLQSPEAQLLKKEIIARSPGAVAATAENYAATYMSSGTRMPRMGLAASGAEMIKVVPKGMRYRHLGLLDEPTESATGSIDEP